MSMMTCNKCGKEYSDKARSCPSCGKPNKMTQGERTIIISRKKLVVISCFLFVLALVFFVFGATRFTENNFGKYKRFYVNDKIEYIENIDINSRKAEKAKDAMIRFRGEMIKASATAAVCFIDGGVLICFGVMLLKARNPKEKKAT